MLMPALLPQELSDYASFDNEDALISALIRKPQDLISFFDYACDDETWSNKYSEFMRKTIAWITMQSFQGKLGGDLLKKAASSLQEHYDNLHSRLPMNLIFKLNDTSIQVNSALYAAASPFYNDLIRRECFDKKNFKLEFPNVSYAHVFRYVEEYVNTGKVSGLWRMESDEVLGILHYAAAIQLPGLAALCEEVLQRYLTPKNVYEMLIMAQNESLELLKQACFDFINNEKRGVYLELKGAGTVGCKFLEFSEKSMEVFERIHMCITHLIFSDSVADNPQFTVVVRNCPRLSCIDLSHSNYFSDYLINMPSNLREINLSCCEWLSSQYLKKIIETCPSLRSISLASNVQLTPNGWGELIRLKTLTAIDISRCMQVRDEDLKIILHACGGVTDLNMEECKLITEKAYFDLARACPRLQRLNLSRTNIGDPSLIEIGSRCRSLAAVNLTRCDRLTDRGITEFVKQGLSLQDLNITSCKITKSIIEGIVKQKPLLRIIF